MKASRSSMLGLLGLVLVVSAASQWWAGRRYGELGAQVAAQVAALARPGDIRMLASKSCSICVAARAWFAEHKVPYSACLIEQDPACRAAFDASGSPGTPVMVVRGQPQVGFNPQRLRGALQRRG